MQFVFVESRLHLTTAACDDQPCCPRSPGDSPPLPLPPRRAHGSARGHTQLGATARRPFGVWLDTLLRRHERDAVEARYAVADVQLPCYELVPLVSPAVKLASGATLVQRGDKLVAMAIEKGYRRLRFRRTTAGKPAEDCARSQPVLQCESQRSVEPPLASRNNVEAASQPLCSLGHRSSVPERTRQDHGTRGSCRQQPAPR